MIVATKQMTSKKEYMHIVYSLHTSSTIFNPFLKMVFKNAEVLKKGLTDNKVTRDINGPPF